MKVLQINCVYQKGSTGKITKDIHDELTKCGISSIVCYGRGARITEPGVYKTCGELYAKINNLRSRFTGIMYGGCGSSTRHLINIIQKEQPDIVHLQCINGYFVNIYTLLNWLKDHNIKTVLTLHAEFMYTGNCGYALDCDRWLNGCGSCPRLKQETQSLLFDNTHRAFLYMKNAFQGFEELTVTSVSPWLMERAKQSPILKDKTHQVILNGLDTGVFFPRDTLALKERHGILDEKIVFHATAAFSDDPSHLKGGWYVLELARRMADQPVRFLIAGNCHLRGPVPDNVTLLGNVENQDLLAQYYSMADVTLLTSRKETFSMPCAESLCCGTPVAGFMAGAPEMISLENYSTFVPFGDTAALQQTLSTYLFHSDFDCDAIAREAAAAYSKQKMVDQYIALYRSMLK